MGIEGIDNLKDQPKNGIFPHKCEEAGCSHVVEFDDEPYCYTHSPDSGSSVRGYSAFAKAQAAGDLRVVHRNVFGKGK